MAYKYLVLDSLGRPVARVHVAGGPGRARCGGWR